MTTKSEFVVYASIVYLFLFQVKHTHTHTHTYLESIFVSMPRLNIMKHDIFNAHSNKKTRKPREARTR